MSCKILKILFFLILTVSVLAGCSTQDTGTLTFHANGENFVRQGFVSKDGWSISFDNVFITLDKITAYQTEPPYNPHEGGKVESGTKVSLEGAYTVDLAQGSSDANPVFVGEVKGAPIGQAASPQIHN